MQTTDDALEITSDSPCIGHCTTVLGDDVCRSCLRTFEEVSRWLEMTEEERRAVNRRIALVRAAEISGVHPLTSSGRTDL